MQLQLYNSLTKTKSPFIPLDPKRIGIYVCGPTVYDYPHLGNALAVVIYDVLVRLLKFVYDEDKVIYVRNITDVDDKIIIAAKAQNISMSELTTKITGIFQQNMQKLNCLEPNFEPKATEHINEMIEMIEQLLKNDFAYISNKHVYFRVHKFNSYGDLSGRHLGELIAGARVEIDSFKENPEDFILWKPADDEDCSFASPYGPGRPGWHIECSAMSRKYLGSDFDLHGGGVDLIFPHHSNEIAQSCCANQGSKYANFWIHNGFLTVNGEKMSKSLGNFITIEDLLLRPVKGEVIRYVLLASHYRKPIDWNEKSLQDAQKALDSFYRILREENITQAAPIPQEFLETLLDDLNTPKSFALLHEYASQYNKLKDPQIAAKLKACGVLLGFFASNPNEWFMGTSINQQAIEEQIKQRLNAKANKNWHLADQIRNQLKEQNIILEDDTNGGCSWRHG